MIEEYPITLIELTIAIDKKLDHYNGYELKYTPNYVYIEQNEGEHQWVYNLNNGDYIKRK